MDTGKTQTVEVERIAGGGAGVAHLDDGRVVFVEGALPGDEVAIEITQAKKRFARARTVEVISAGPYRVEPSCGHVAAGCGGCDWQHVAVEAQLDLKMAIVVDALTRIGRLDDPPVRPGPQLSATGHRTTVRALVSGGVAGYRRRRSHDHVSVDSCEVAHPRLVPLLVDGRFGDAHEVTLRVGATTGERMALVDPTVEGVELPGDVLVVGTDELADGRRAWIHDEVAGRRWRISAASFFQSRPDGAEVLVDLVRAGLADAPAGALIDLYAGVGLFAGTVGAGRAVTAVELNASAVADARINLADLDSCKIVASTVEDWWPSPAAVVVADPARSGLGQVAVDRIAATNATCVVLVSCDAGSLGRDAGLLRAAGYRLDAATVVDMFPKTSHIEIVSAFEREAQ